MYLHNAATSTAVQLCFSQASRNAVQAIPQHAIDYHLASSNTIKEIN